MGDRVGEVAKSRIVLVGVIVVALIAGATAALIWVRVAAPVPVAVVSTPSPSPSPAVDLACKYVHEAIAKGDYLDPVDATNIVGAARTSDNAEVRIAGLEVSDRLSILTRSATDHSDSVAADMIRLQTAAIKLDTVCVQQGLTKP